MKALLREHVSFGGAEDLFQQLSTMDPAFRAAATVVEYEYEVDSTYSGVTTRYSYLTFEAELDVSS